jgi:hypothetical protein
MLDKHALLMGSALITLSELKTVCVPFHDDEKAKKYQVPIENIERLGLHAIRLIKQACILSDMNDVIPQIDRLQMLFTMEPPFPKPTHDQIAISVINLVLRIKDELNSEYYFHLDQRDVSFYLTKEPFGQAVSHKFALACEDIEEAGKCLALQQSTACVFHLMRAMEVVVKRLGKRLKVKNVEKEWGKILSDIGNAISQMPKGTERERKKRNNWSEAHVNLYHVKQAWRNDTMHPKQTYTRDEALKVYEATRTFISHLAELV